MSEILYKIVWLFLASAINAQLWLKLELQEASFKFLLWLLALRSVMVKIEYSGLQISSRRALLSVLYKLRCLDYALLICNDYSEAQCFLVIMASFL